MNIDQILLGANAMASLVVGLLFLRFWRDTLDRFFLFFATAFAVEGLNRIALAMVGGSQETEPYFYLVRLFSFLLILAAIVDKNRIKNKSPKYVEKH